MPLNSGQRLGAYEILSSLGSGGMGEVYRARDSRLGRDVALKVLPPEVINEPGRLERFDREARAIAALNHPHIVTIYSTEEADGMRFLTMELVDGCTLGDLIMPSGMAIPKFLEIAWPLADALAAAHQKQITHRDLKPGNVMVSNDGRVKVLDFGLARVGGADAGEQTLIATQAPITHQGMIVGTMPYMSPEQVEGRTLDPRTDLFSLGVIFYELLSGSRPFSGSSSPALMSAILRDTPSSVCEKRPEIPEAIDRLIARLLEKRPEDRVQTARDVFNELKHVKAGSGSPTVQRKFDERSTYDNLRIAVLPFTVRGADADAEAMAAGLTEDITTSLGKFPGLTVVASQTTRAFKDSPLDVRDISLRIGARYIISGHVRKSGAAIRTTGQLIDAKSGAQLWTETYDRRIEGGADLFTIQDDVVDHIVATLADQSGALAQSMMLSVPQGSIGGVTTPEQLIVRMWGFQNEPAPSAHAELRAGLEQQLESDSNNADLWAMLSNLYICEHSLMYNPLPDSLGRAARAARRAIEIDRGNQSGWLWLGLADFHLHDRPGLEEAFDRVMRINPRNARAMAWVGAMLTHAGDYERGTQLTARAMQINPAHPGWVHISTFNRHFAEGNFEAALQAARRVNIPNFFWMHFTIAAAAGQLGRIDEGRQAAETMARIQPAVADEASLRDFITRWYWPEEMIESLLNGVRLARSSERPSEPPFARPPSSSSNLRSGALSIAVQPFVARSADEDSTAIADGLTDDITSGLSRFGYLRVLALAASTGAARYTLSGQVRKAGTSLRISATLADRESGANIWAEHYDRAISETPFAIQDDVASSIVATVGDETGVLMRSMAASTADLPLDQLSVAELVVRYHAYADDYRPDEHARLRSALEGALQREPRAAEGWACLAMLYEHEHGFGYNRLPNTLQRHRDAAERAVALDSRSQKAWSAMATVHLFAKDLAGVRAVVDRVAALNPLNADLISRTALFLGLAGDYDRALALTNDAIARKPHHPASYHFVPFLASYAKGDDELALQEAKRLWMPMLPVSNLVSAAVAGQLARRAEAKVALDALRHIDPSLLSVEAARQVWTTWILDEAMIERLVNGFAKALALIKPPSSAVRHDGASIAVLPFADLSEKKDQDWFCDGIAEEILNALSPLPGLRVAARASAFSLRGKTDDLRAIGEKLNVTTVLEGSVRRAGDRVRITAQLSDAQQGRQLWSERFDRDLKDIFDVQDEIARAIVDRLRISLTGNDRLVQKQTTDIAAYELLLKGRELLTRRGPAIINAIACFEQAIAIDPDLSAAHAGLGDTYRLMSIYGLMPSDQVMPTARASLERALALDPNEADALATLANIKHAYEWDFAASRALTERALRADRMHVRAMTESSIMTATAMADPPSPAQTRFVLDRIAEARQLDPLNAWVMAMEGLDLALIGRPEEAVAAATRAVATSSNNFTAHWALVASLASMGRQAEARGAAAAALAMSGRHHMILAEVAALDEAAGDRAAAEVIFRELQARAQNGYMSAAARATVAASAGLFDEARALLAEAIAGREAFVTFYKLPAWRPLRNDPACAAMLGDTRYVKHALK